MKLEPYDTPVELYDLPDSRAYEVAQSEGYDPDIVDVPIDDLLDNNEPPSEFDIDQASPRKVLERVRLRGSFIFNEGQGRMLVKCPAYGKPASCPLHPGLDHESQKPRLVCTGPNVARKTKTSFLGLGEKETYYGVEPCHSECPHHPENLHKPTQERGADTDNTVDEKWL
jgi:hypothetical protein